MMKKILAGCLAAAMICGGIAAEAVGDKNALRQKISAINAPEESAGFMIPEAVEEDNSGFMIPEAVEEDDRPEAAEQAQARKPGQLMGQISAAKQGKAASETDVPETSAAIMVPEAVEEDVQADSIEAVETDSSQARKPGDLMSRIHASRESDVSVYVGDSEEASIGIIGGVDGPTSIMIGIPEAPAAVPEIAENTATEPIPAEAEAPLAFVLRDAITWDSTTDEVAAMFDADVTVEETRLDKEDGVLVPVDLMRVSPVSVSNFEGTMNLYFHEGQLWSMGYVLKLKQEAVEQLELALTMKYGEGAAGMDAYAEAMLPLSAHEVQVYRDGFELSRNWTAQQNTQIFLMYDGDVVSLVYLNSNYMETLHAAAAQSEINLFGI